MLIWNSLLNFFYFYVALRDEIQKKLDKMQEPPPVKQVKPLPKPDDAPRKKRGGRRYAKFCMILMSNVYVHYVHTYIHVYRISIGFFYNDVPCFSFLCLVHMPIVLWLLNQAHAAKVSAHLVFRDYFPKKHMWVCICPQVYGLSNQVHHWIPV